MFLKRKKYRTIDMVLIMYKVTPFLCTLVILEKILSAAYPVINIYVTANFIDTAKDVVYGNIPQSAIILPITLLVALNLFQFIIGYIMGFVQNRVEIKSRTKIRMELLEVRAKLDYKYIESQEKLDVINRVCGNLDDGIKNQFYRILEFGVLIAQIISIMTVLVMHVYWYAVILTVVCIPLFYVAVKAGQKNYEANQEVTKINRKAGYLNGLLKSRDAVEERYIYGYTEKLNKEYIDEYEKSRIFMKKVDKKNFINMKAGSVIFAILTVIIAGVLLPPTLAGIISIGIFISLLQALSSLIQSMSWGLTWFIKEMEFYRRYLKDVEEFMKLNDTDQTNILLPAFPPIEFKDLEFRNVSFSYPGTDTYVLKNMSFKMIAGKHYSIVGINGAGKTTVTKLITGLYKDFEGEIFINGKSIFEYKQAELKSLCAVVYQDFAKYYITFGENIAIGDINHFDDYKSGNTENVEKAVEFLGLREVVLKLPKGLDTPLGKIKEDGLDVSGGEWQRIALARLLLNPAPIRILDEPTAALDPISESNVYKQFEEISRNDQFENQMGKTTIFISHRLGSTKLADEIIVIGDGKVLEQGTHNELMETRSVYYEMYTTQADWYRSAKETTINRGRNL